MRFLYSELTSSYYKQNIANVQLCGTFKADRERGSDVQYILVWCQGVPVVVEEFSVACEYRNTHLAINGRGGRADDGLLKTTLFLPRVS